MVTKDDGETFKAFKRLRYNKLKYFRMHLLVYSQSETLVLDHGMFKFEEFYILTNKIH